MDTRVLITIILALALIFVYQEVVLKKLYPPPPPHHKAETAHQKAAAMPSAPLTAAPSAQPTAISPAAAAAESAPLGKLAPAESQAAPARTIEVDTNRYQAIFTTRGARLKDFYLKKYRETSARDSPLYNVVKPGNDGVLPLGLVVTRDGETLSDAQLNYATTAPPKIKVTPGHPVTIILTAHARNGLDLTKVYTFRDAKYVFDMKGVLSGDMAGVSEIGFAMSQSLHKLPGYYDVPELQADVSGKVFTEEEKGLKKGVAPTAGKVTYAGFGDRYFLSVFLPAASAEGSLAMAYSQGGAHIHLLFAGATTIKSAVYMGPKQIHILEDVNPALSKAIDFGWMGIIALPFLRALQIFHYVAPNYGVAIILLTIVVRLLTLPMSIKGQRSMMRMQRLQPQIEKIREKFKNDTERLNREMVDLYKRNHVNPIGGCLPMLIQLPILWGLYEALLNAVELRNAPFIGWITDLSAPDCLHVAGMPAIPFTDCHGIPVLVILLAVTSLIQQWMSPKQPDPSQQKMMMYMPVVFSLIFIDLPAGLSLYYLASNVLGIVQQFFLNYEFKQYNTANATTAT